ncbi:MAG: hypothetical protein IPK94_08455 [Saprospiraceae bacterium]|nr:hypothetical protein [Saprospiraceae bacterium]
MIQSGGRINNISSGTTRISNPGYSVCASRKERRNIYKVPWPKSFGAKGISANIVARSSRN